MSGCMEGPPLCPSPICTQTTLLLSVSRLLINTLPYLITASTCQQQGLHCFNYIMITSITSYAMIVYSWCANQYTVCTVSSLKIFRMRDSCIFFTGSVTVLIIELWQYCVCCIRPEVTLCILAMVLDLSRIYQCGLHVVFWSHVGILICASSLQTSQYHRTFIPLPVSLWNKLADPVFDGVGLTGFKSRATAFFLGLSCSIHSCLLLFFPFSSFCL